jgi:hypothetical protein
MAPRGRKRQKSAKVEVKYDLAEIFLAVSNLIIQRGYIRG